jgi:hypothetical protein
MVVSASSKTKFNFITKKDISTLDTVLEAGEEVYGVELKRKKKVNSYKLFCKQAVWNLRDKRKSTQYSMLLKEKLKAFDSDCKILPNVLRFYLVDEKIGDTLYNLTYESKSDRSMGQIKTHPIATSTKLLLQLPKKVPANVDRSAYVKMAHELIGNWTPRPEVLEDAKNDLPF